MVSSRQLNFFLLLLIILLFETVEIEGKSKQRMKFALAHPPQYEIHPTNQLPSDLQITTFLYKGETKTFLYLSNINNGPLSATITPCSSGIAWTFSFGQHNITTGKPFDEGSTVYDITTKFLTGSLGWYTLEITAKDRETYVNIYISTEEGGPLAIQKSKQQELTLLKRQKRNRLTVRWEESVVDPQRTEYCLVTSTQKNYRSLCAAVSTRFGVTPPQSHSRYPVAASQTVITATNNFASKEEPLILCLGKRNHFTISNLIQGQTYYLSVLARNLQTNLTYPYSSAVLKFDKRNKPITLRHDFATFANLKKLDGKAVFRYKVGKYSENKLNLYVMPCGGSVDVDISLKGELMTTRRRIEGFGTIIVPDLTPNARYYIKIVSSNQEGYHKTSGVELYATSKSSSRIPLPSMPVEPVVKEYIPLRKCDSVTVGWMPSPGQKTAHYCLVVKEGRMREMEEAWFPNQCGLEKRLKKSADFALKYCKDIRHVKEQVIMERISQLKPGKGYIVQVTVKKPRGKTLSYDLLQVHTMPSCSKL